MKENEMESYKESERERQSATSTYNEEFNISVKEYG